MASRFFETVLKPLLHSVVFWIGKVTNEIGFQGKKLQKRKYWFFFAFVLGMCAIVTYLF
jgi:NADH-quinone oxidoreductase subunit L